MAFIKLNLQSVNHTKVVNSCQTILNTVISNELIMTQDSEERYSLNLKGYSYFGATDRGRLIKVVPLYKDFWLHFSIQFNVQPVSRKRSEYFIAGVSLAIFYGQATDNDKLLMFRAEWDNKKIEDVTIPHPQPHWHMHSSGSDLRAEDISDFNVFMNDFKEVENNAFLNALGKGNAEATKVIDLSGFHFAMSAGWFFGESDRHTLTEDSLKIWLVKSVTHIQEQIAHCC